MDNFGFFFKQFFTKAKNGISKKYKKCETIFLNFPEYFVFVYKKYHVGHSVSG